MGARQLPAGLQITPSLLSADFAELGAEIRAVEAGGVELLHLDVMDGHFVPNITFGPPVVRSVRRSTELFLDTHLMIARPLEFLEPFVEAGADLLTLHIESLDSTAPAGGTTEPTPRALEAFARAERILGDLGCLLGLSFRPGTDPEPWLQRVGERLDLVLIMTVEPGFGGQRFMGHLVERIAAVRRLALERAWRYRVSVDGGVARDTIGACAGAGADILVAGNAIFGAEDRVAAVRGLQQAAAAAVPR